MPENIVSYDYLCHCGHVIQHLAPFKIFDFIILCENIEQKCAHISSYINKSKFTINLIHFSCTEKLTLSIMDHQIMSKYQAAHWSCNNWKESFKDFQYCLNKVCSCLCNLFIFWQMLWKLIIKDFLKLFSFELGCSLMQLLRVSDDDYHCIIW